MAAKRKDDEIVNGDVAAQAPHGNGGKCKTRFDRRSFIATAAAAAMVGLPVHKSRAATKAGEAAGADAAPAAGRPDTSAVIGRYMSKLSYDDLDPVIVEAAKIRLLDVLAAGIAAIDEPDIAIVRNTIEASPDGRCTLFGSRLRATAAEAAMVNTSMTRYLDFMDAYSRANGGGHPGDCVAAAIACAEHRQCSTRNLITAIVSAYEIFGAFVDNVNTRDRGWDHLVYGGIAMATGASKALELSAGQMQQAVGIQATAANTLRATRAEQLTMWKGFAAGNSARTAVYSALLAMNGMEGPTNPFNGHGGWKEVIAGADFVLDLTPGTRILGVLTKFYVAETSVLSAVEGAIGLSVDNDIDTSRIKDVNVKTFHTAILNAGAAEGRDPYRVRTREEADHSFPYMVAAALIDREMTRDQYTPERISRADVQQLLRKVRIEGDSNLTERHENGEMPAIIEVTMDDGTRYQTSKKYFKGHQERPATWEQICEKFLQATSKYMDENEQERLIGTVHRLEDFRVNELTSQLS